MRNAFIRIANSYIKYTNLIIKALNLINPFKQNPLIQEFAYETKKNLEDVGDTAEDVSDKVNALTFTPKTAKSEVSKEEKARLKKIAEAQKAAQQEQLSNEMDAFNEMLNTKAALEDEYYQSLLSKEQQELNAVEEKYFSIIEAAKEAGLDTIELENAKQAEIDDIIKDAAQRKIDEEKKAAKESERITKEELDEKLKGYREFSKTVGKILGSLSGLQSAMADKENAEFEIWKANQDKRSENLDLEMEREIERVEQSGLNAEAQKDRKTDIQEEYAAKKESLDNAIAAKEKNLKRKQATREKAMNIANAIMNTAEAVTSVIANPILAAIVGALGAAQVATIASTPIPFAKGGLVSGATLGLIGEGSGTSAFNPEVVSPLDKLQKMLGGQIDVHGRIQGNNIVLVSDKAEISRQRFI